MLKTIAAAGFVAALALGFASAASAKDYNDILSDKGVVSYESAAPFQYSEYGQNRGYEGRAQARVAPRNMVRTPYAVDQFNSAETWPGQW